MAHYGTLKDYRFATPEEAADDIRGAKVYGRDDDKLGKIDDVIVDHSTGHVRYAVIDAGGWLSSKKFVVPPERLRQSSEHPEDFEISATKQEIEKLPRYNESEVETGHTWEDYERRYKAAWHDGPVQHRKGSDRDITPTPSEMSEESGSIGSQLTKAEQAELSSRIIPAGADEVTIQNSGAGIGSRWLTFESRLRQHRRDITRSCTSCAVGPAADREESAGQEREAI